jgi:transcriptional regulator with XRE-family HTH domain
MKKANYSPEDIKKLQIVADTIKSLMESHQMSLSDLGNVIGVKKNTLHNYLTLRNPMPLTHLIKIANYFDVSLDYFTTKQQNDARLLAAENEKEYQ